MVNPTRVRALSKATGKLAKTDVIDARLIAEYAFKRGPEVLGPQEAQEIRLKALVSRREQLVAMRTTELNRLGTAHNSMRADIREHVEWMTARIQQLEAEIEQLVDSMPEWRVQAERLDSIPGVGLITAITVLAEMPELGELGTARRLPLWLGWPLSTGIVASYAASDGYLVVAKAFAGYCIWPACPLRGAILSFVPYLSA